VWEMVTKAEFEKRAGSAPVAAEDTTTNTIPAERITSLSLSHPIFVIGWRMNYFDGMKKLHKETKSCNRHTNKQKPCATPIPRN
jgi:hypothetical protein